MGVAGNEQALHLAYNGMFIQTENLMISRKKQSDEADLLYIMQYKLVR